MSEEEENEEAANAEKAQKKQVNIAGPMIAWVVLLIIGLVLKIVITLSGLLTPASSVYGIVNGVANFLLFIPGTIILPLIVGAVIGAEVGLKSKDIQSALRSGLLNGVYAAFVYLVAIVVIYMTLYYGVPNAVPLLSIIFLLSNLALPILVLIGVSMVFAVLSHSRKVL